MPIKTTIGCAALAIAACFGIGTASASPLVVNKSVGATSQLQNVDYHCYRRHGRRYCRDTYEDYEDSYYDDYGYGPGVVIGRHRHHHDHGNVHYYRGSPGGGPSGRVGHGPSGGGMMRGGGGGPVGHASIGGGGGVGGHGGGGGGGHR